MQFQKLELGHIDRLRPYFTQNNCRICDCTIGGTFIWRDFFQTEFALQEDYLYLKVVYLTDDIAFTPPRGPECADKAVYERLVDYCGLTGCTPRLCAVSTPRLEKILALYPNAKTATDRAWSDYLYASEDLKGLAGRKYSGQRNHINKFLKAYDNWTFEEVGPANIGEMSAFFQKYAAQPDSDYPALDECNHKSLEVLDHLDQYGLVGGMLKVSGSVIGTALGETVGDTHFVHIEKADTDYLGAYQMLVNQYAKVFAQDVAFINREEDDGVEGLRKSKLSYHPVQLLDKYVVELA